MRILPLQLDQLIYFNMKGGDIMFYVTNSDVIPYESPGELFSDMDTLRLIFQNPSVRSEVLSYFGKDKIVLSPMGVRTEYELDIPFNTYNENAKCLVALSAPIA